MAVVANRDRDCEEKLGRSEHGSQVSFLNVLPAVNGAHRAVTSDAMRADPNSPDVMTVRGLLLFLTSKTAQATQHVQSALRLDPGHEAAMKLRKRIKDVERLKEEGNVAFKTNKLQEAADKYGEAIERIGSDPREGEGGQIRAMLLSNRATTLVKLDRYEDALADTEASLQLNPTSFKALRTRARINLHLENYDAAIADFKSAIEQAGFENCDADVRALKGELKKAELALKRSKTKDYYKILGVERECTDVEIRKAYRRESLKHHPDKVRSIAHTATADAHRPSRVETRRSSSSSSRRMVSCQTLRSVNVTIWAMTMTRGSAAAAWARASTSPSCSLSSTGQVSAAVADQQGSRHSVAVDTQAAAMVVTHREAAATPSDGEFNCAGPYQTKYPV